MSKYNITVWFTGACAGVQEITTRAELVSLPVGYYSLPGASGLTTNAVLDYIDAQVRQFGKFEGGLHLQCRCNWQGDVIHV